MKVIPPLTLYGSGRVVSSSVSEPDITNVIPAEQIYDVGTTYGLNDQAIETVNHREYQSLQAGNVGHALPNFSLGETVNAWWVDIGSSNKWAMFDLSRNNATFGASPLVVQIAPGVRSNTLALLGLAGQTVTVSGTSVAGGGTVYGPVVKNIAARIVNNWYDYFYAPFGATPSILLMDLPPYGDLILTISIDNGIGQAGCASIVVGNYTYIGDMEFNPVSDAINLSLVTRDIFGNVVFTPRRSIPKTTQKVFAIAGLANTIRQLRASLNAQVALWVGLDDITADYGESLIIVGFYRAWTMDLSNGTVLEQTLEIEEL